MRRPKSRSSFVVVLLALLSALGGCGTTSRGDLRRQHLGIRPDEPKLEALEPDRSETGGCGEYKAYFTYAQQLQEAYHSRATQNRLWLYVAGILGLGVAAASGGLAAAAAAGAGTIALLSISGGFAAATFATIDNSDLAQIYTISANRIEQAMRESDTALPFSGRFNDAAACGHALRVLKDGVSDARTVLEQSRTNVAVAALVRAKDQRDMLDKLIAGQQPTDPTRVTQTLFADIADLDPKEAQPGKETLVTLTVKNIRLDQVAPADVKVLFGTKELPLEGPPQPDAKDPHTYMVKFKASADPPDKERGQVKKEYSPALLLVKTKQRVASQTGKTFTYP